MSNLIKVRNNRITSKINKRNKELIKKALSQVIGFFGKGKISFNIIFIKKRVELNKARGYKTKKWEVGGIFEDDTILIFDKEVFDKVSPHPKKYFYSTLVHEIAHIYTEKHFGFLYPIWLTEGIAYVVARQDKEIKKYKKKDIRKGHYDKDWIKDTYYTSSCRFTKYLLDNFGKDKLMGLMKILKMYEKKREFYKKFEKVFGKSFNRVYKDYQKIVEKKGKD